MSNITVRNIPDEIMNKIRALSQKDRRSINSEILVLLEKASKNEFAKNINNSCSLYRDAQIQIWKKLCGQWKDKRPTEEIIKDIISSRTPGRKVDL